MEIFDVLIIGGGPAGLSCALTLGSAAKKPFVADKKIGIILHQSDSGCNTALFNNVLGIAPGTYGVDVLKSGNKTLTDLYPHIQQIQDEKVISILEKQPYIIVISEKEKYTAKQIVIAVTPSPHINIEGLSPYIEPHQKMPPEKNKVQLKNKDHLVTSQIYVAGVLAGHRSQLMIAARSGAAVATDILTMWNDGKHTTIHDVLPKEK